MPSALSHDPSISTPGASTDNAIVIFDGTGGTGFGNSTILVDSGGNGRIGIAADTDIITVTAETVTIAGKVVATSLDIGDGDTTIEVTQSNHNLTVGMPVRVSGANQYAAAQANSATNAEVVGIVTSVASSSAFTLTLAGEVTTTTAVPDSTSPGDIVYLSASSAGAVTTTEPSTAGQVSKPIGVVTEANNKMILLPFRGEVISSATDSMDLNGTELVLDADADTSITADTDDQIDIRLSGADDFQFTANSFTALAGSTITSPSFITGNSGTLKLMDSDGSNFFTLAANATTTADVNYTWPAAGPASNGYALTATTAGVLSWAEIAGGPTINSATANEVVTVASNTANLDAEAKLLFDGDNLVVGQTSNLNTVPSLLVHKETAVGNQYGTLTISSRDNLSGANGNFGIAWQQVNASNAIQATRGQLYFNNQTNNMEMSFGGGNRAFNVKRASAGGSIAAHSRSVLTMEHSDEASFSLVGPNNRSQFIEFCSNSSGGPGYIQYVHGSNFYVFSAGAENFRIYGNGNITSGNGSSTFHTGSDVRIKENITDSSYGLAEVLQLRSVKFNFADWHSPNNNPTRVGLIAQEVEEVLPELVGTNPQEISYTKYDDDVQDIVALHEPLSGLKAIDDQQMISVLIKAIQELDDKVTALGG